MYDALSTKRHERNNRVHQRSATPKYLTGDATKDQKVAAWLAKITKIFKYGYCKILVSRANGLPRAPARAGAGLSSPPGPLAAFDDRLSS